jgi:DNA modification methylase
MSFYGLHKVNATQLLEVFPKLKSGKYKPCVDVTITSPPYWNLKNYDFQSQIGYGQSYEDYLGDLEKVFAKIYKITKDSGSLWIIVDTFKKKKKDRSLSDVESGELVFLPSDIAKRVRSSGWKLRDIFIWEKDRTLPWSRKGQLRNIFEYILFFTKKSDFKFYVDRIRISDYRQLKEWWVKYPERYNPSGAVPTDVWKYPIPVQGSWARGFLRHFCPFPVALIQRILLLTTNRGNTVLDPFAGSGGVLAVAHHMKRRFIGFELKLDYLKMFRENVLKEVASEMENRVKALKKRRRMQSNLKQTIRKLRLTKYPKVLIKQLYLKKLVQEADFPINTIFAIKRKFDYSRLEAHNNWKFLREDVYLVFEENVNEKDLHENISKLSSSPPLSKFGIEPNFYITSWDTFVEQETYSPSFNHKQLWLYRKGMMNIFHKRLEFDRWKNLSKGGSWKEHFKEKIPPVMSNIKVNQPVVKASSDLLSLK